MVKTSKIKSISRNKTKKNKENTMKICPIGLKPFEKELKKTLPNHIPAVNHRKHLFIKQLMSKFAPNSIKPVNDFYDYINYTWLKNVGLEQQQKYIVQVDDFRLVQDKVYNELDQIILEYIKTHNDKLSKNLKNFRDSIIKMNPLSYSKHLAKEAEKTIERFINEDNPWKLLAFINKDEMISFRAPFVWSLNPDEKNTKIYRCYVNPHQFTLLDLNVYFDDGTDVEYKRNYRNKFNKYVKKLFTCILGENHYNPKDILDVEIEIFNALGCTEITTKEEKPYNKITAEESFKKYGFDWNEFSKALGFKTPPKFFITSNINYLKCLFIKKPTTF